MNMRMDNSDSSFWSVFSSGPVLDNLGKYLSIGDIVNVSRTCRSLTGLYRELLCTQWDVDHMLKRFVKRPRDFRYQLGRSEALITGSFALEYFERSHWRAPGLDIAVIEDLRSDELADYLVCSEDYSFEEINDYEEPPVSFKHVNKVKSFQKTIRGSNFKVRLFLLSSYSTPVKAIMEGFWTTSIVNFLSWRMAYSIFPGPTFLEHKSYLLTPPSIDHAPLPFRKYHERGWTFEVGVPISKGHHVQRHPMRKCRKVGDRSCWTIPFNNKDIQLPRSLDPVHDDVVVYISEAVIGVDEETVATLRSYECFEMPDNLVHYYEASQLKYSGFFT